MDYQIECYGVFTATNDYWYTGDVETCRVLATQKFKALVAADVPCELVNAMIGEDIDSYKM